MLRVLKSKNELLLLLLLYFFIHYENDRYKFLYKY